MYRGQTHDGVVPATGGLTSGSSRQGRLNGVSAKREESATGSASAVVRAAVPCPACAVCGRAGRVRVLAAYANGVPVMEDYCLRCASGAPVRSPRPSARRARTGTPVLLGLAGVLLAVIGVFADVILPSAKAGFGVYQQGGVVIGALLILFGAVTRADVIAVCGTFLFISSLCGDLLGMTRGAGIGWKQQAILWASVACLGCALLNRAAFRAGRQRALALPGLVKRAITWAQ